MHFRLTAPLRGAEQPFSVTLFSALQLGCPPASAIQAFPQCHASVEAIARLLLQRIKEGGFGWASHPASGD